MKLKELDRTANVAWSPEGNQKIYLAAGTAAQQLDSSFSSNAVLELYDFDVTQPGLDMPISASLPCESRFHKLAWGSHGISTGADEEGQYPNGLLVAGCDNGLMQVYDVAKILANDADPVVLTKSKHTGPVRALDFNSFRPYIVASGASDSEIYIWDFNNPKTAMSTGTKSQPADDVTHLAWNKQVEHILASTFSTRCVMWDLRKNEPIIKVADTTSRIRYKAVEWHPTVATQMCLASEDDSSPVIQLWDLRFATSPLKVLQGHQRGVLALAWCKQDPELLLSCGKDSNIMCWNPNHPYPGYELVCEIPTTSQWSFDVSFCPKNPLVISSSSFDGRVSLFGLSGGAQQAVTSSKLADSFPGMDMTISQAPVPSQKPLPIQLRDAPKWLKRPCGASFAFGGKLIQFENIKNTQGQGAPDQRIVTISQVVTLPNFLSRSQKLEATLASGGLAEFCDEKANSSGDESEKNIWQYLRASFAQNPAFEYLEMLGFNPNEISAKLANVVGNKGINRDIDSLTDGFVSLAQGDSFGNQPSDNCLDINGPKFDDFAAPSTLSEVFQIPTGENIEGLLNQALLSGNIECAVDLCLKEDRWPEAFIVATYGGPELSKYVQRKYFQKCRSKIPQLVQIIVSQDWKSLVDGCDLQSWQQALATLLTYVTNEREFASLAGNLGKRLESSGDERLQKSAMICYICSGNLDRLADSWTKIAAANVTDGAESLQDLVEQVTVLRKSAETRGRQESVAAGPLSSKMVEYATLLASQGSLESALKYLSDSTDASAMSLKQRIQYALGYQMPRPGGIAPRSRQTSESSTSSYHHRSSLAQKRPSYSSSTPSYPSNPALSNGVSNSYNQQVYTPQMPSNQSVAPPLPPVSSAAHGWNDPPPFSSASKPKVPGSQATAEPITHPIFGSGPVPNNPAPPMGGGDYSAFGTPFGQSSYGSNAFSAPPTGPPKPPSGSGFGGGQSSMSTPGAPPSTQSLGTAPPTSAAYQPGSVIGQKPPAPATSNYMPALFTPTPGAMSNTPDYSHSSYGTPGFSSRQPTNNFGPPPSTNFPAAPPPTSGFTPGPPPASGFAPGPPPSSGFTPGPPPASGFAPGSNQSSGFPPRPPQSSGFAAGPPPSAGFAARPPQSSGFAAGPPQSSGFAAGPPQSSGFAAGPPQSSGFAAGPPQSSSFTPGPPPVGGAPTGPPPTSGFTPGPPPTSGFTPGPTANTGIGAPPASGFAPGPPASGRFTPGVPLSGRHTPGAPTSSGFATVPPAGGYTAGPVQSQPTATFTPGPPPTGLQSGQSSSSNFASVPPPSGRVIPGNSSNLPGAATSTSLFQPGPPQGTAFQTGVANMNSFQPGPPVSTGFQSGPPTLSSSSQGFGGLNSALRGGNPAAPGAASFPPPARAAPSSQSPKPLQTPGAAELTPTFLDTTFPPSNISSSFDNEIESALDAAASALPTSGGDTSVNDRPATNFSDSQPTNDGFSDSGWDSIAAAQNQNPISPSSAPLSREVLQSPESSALFSPSQGINAPPSAGPSLGSGKSPVDKGAPQQSGGVSLENKQMLEILEKLRLDCYNVAALPQIKRKLEDVARKLEILNEKLREESLSTSTLSLLRNIVDAMKNGDYQLALSIHTQLITAGNFAEISTFLPSIKVLIQSAAQLNVFL